MSPSEYSGDHLKVVPHSDDEHVWGLTRCRFPLCILRVHSQEVQAAHRTGKCVRILDHLNSVQDGQVHARLTWHQPTRLGDITQAAAVREQAAKEIDALQQQVDLMTVYVDAARAATSAAAAAAAMSGGGDQPAPVAPAVASAANESLGGLDPPLVLSELRVGFSPALTDPGTASVGPARVLAAQFAAAAAVSPASQGGPTSPDGQEGAVGPDCQGEAGLSSSGNQDRAKDDGYGRATGGVGQGWVQHGGEQPGSPGLQSALFAAEARLMNAAEGQLHLDGKGSAIRPLMSCTCCGSQRGASCEGRMP